MIIALLFALLSVSPALAFDGAKLQLSADQSLANGTNQVISWATADYDTLSFFNPAQPTRLTVPNGVSWVRLTGSQVYATSCGGTMRQLIITKNGTWFSGDPVINTPPTCSGTTTDISGFSPVTPVVPGDYFEVSAFQNTGSALNLRWSTGTWFSIEVVP